MIDEVERCFIQHFQCKLHSPQRRVTTRDSHGLNQDANMLPSPPVTAKSLDCSEQNPTSRCTAHCPPRDDVVFLKAADFQSNLEGK
jgi:hypothetical protein